VRVPPALLVGLGVFFACSLAGTQISRRALLALSPDQKVGLVDLAARGRGLGVLIAALLVGAYFVALTSFARPDLALAALMVLAAVTAVAALLAGQRRLRRLGLRRDQARQFLLGAGTRLAGLIGLLVAVYASLRR
jgi:hypothetical protein